MKYGLFGWFDWPQNPFYHHKSLKKFKDRLNEWEYDFITSIHKRWELSPKQQPIANRIHKKLYKKSNVKRAITKGQDVEQMFDNIKEIQAGRQHKAEFMNDIKNDRKMRLIKPYYEILPEIKTIQDMKRNIELGGRVCYKSEQNITENSSEKFIENLIKSGHTSVLEHGTVYLKIPLSILDVSVEYDIIIYKDLLTKYQNNEYTAFNEIFQTIPEEPFGYAYITTNYRVIIENGWEDDLQYWSEPTEYHEKRYSVRFVCDRGVSHEFVRHRSMSMSQESTRKTIAA